MSQIRDFSKKIGYKMLRLGTNWRPLFCPSFQSPLFGVSTANKFSFTWRKIAIMANRGIFKVSWNSFEKSYFLAHKNEVSDNWKVNRKFFGYKSNQTNQKCSPSLLNFPKIPLFDSKYKNGKNGSFEFSSIWLKMFFAENGQPHVKLKYLTELAWNNPGLSWIFF